MRRLTILLAAVGALLLIPAAQAFAHHTVTVKISGTASGKISSVGGYEGSGLYEGSPPIECSGPPATGTCKTELVEEEEPPEALALTLVTPAPVAVKEWVTTGEGEVGCYNNTRNACIALGFGGDITVEAVLFEAYPLTVSKSGTGTGKVTSSPAGIECPFNCSQEFEKGKEVTLTATPEGGFSVFKEWTGACSGTGTCKVTMSAAKSVGAVFIKTPQLNVSKTGEGSGTVTSSPSGINCGGTCKAKFEEGKEVTLTATAAEGSTFAGWSGSGCSGTGTCKVTMSEEKSVTASFALKSGPTNLRTLTVTKSPSSSTGGGNGTVASKPKGIKCGAACDEAVASMYEGSSVELSAKPSTGSTFVKWVGGDCNGSTNPVCTVGMDKNETTQAVFGGTSKAFSPAEALTLSKGESTGKGTVKASGLACEAECTQTKVLYQGPVTEPKAKPGKVVILKQAPAFGSKFSGWSGCDSIDGEGNCVVAMEEAKEVIAEYEALPNKALTVNKAFSSGNGTVASKPKGIKCGTTCTTQTAQMPEGAPVELTAKPGLETTFVKWEGGSCNGSTNPVCTVTMNADVTTKAVFSKGGKAFLGGSEAALTLKKAGSGFGTVKASGLACEVLCSSATSLYQGPVVSPKAKPGKVVVLKAVSAPGSKAVAWSGCESEPEGNCQVTMETSKSVTATFDELE